MAETAMRGESRKASKKVTAKQGTKGDVPRLLASNGSGGKPHFSKAYGFGLVTAALFLLSWVGQFVTQLLVVRRASTPSA